MDKVGRGVLQAWRREILRGVRERGGVPARWRPQGKRIPEGSFQRNGFVGSPSLGRQGPHGVGVRMVEESSLREVGTRQGMPLCAL